MTEHAKAVLKNQYFLLDEILHDKHQNEFLIKPENGKWSVFENIAHLGRYNEIFFERMQQIQHKNNPEIESYKADDEAGFIEWCGKSFDLMRADFLSSRESLTKFFEFLNEDQLKKTGIHSKFGELTTTDWIDFFILHEAHHLFTIFKLIHQKK